MSTYYAMKVTFPMSVNKYNLEDLKVAIPEINSKIKELEKQNAGNSK